MKQYVRIITDVVDDVNGNKVIEYVASTKDGNKTVTARGRSEQTALSVLKGMLKDRAEIRKGREGYPKTIEVDW